MVVYNDKNLIILVKDTLEEISYKAISAGRYLEYGDGDHGDDHVVIVLH